MVTANQPEQGVDMVFLRTSSIPRLMCNSSSGAVGAGSVYHVRKGLEFFKEDRASGCTHTALWILAASSSRAKALGLLLIGNLS